MAFALQVRNLTKSFPGVLANDHIDLDIEEGEVHGILGENGAGKSVLMSVIYGLYRPDEGKILVRGKEVTIESPAQAIRYGIGMVHQNLTLSPSLRVFENIILGHEPHAFVFLSRREALRRIEGLLEETGLQIDLKARVGDLPIGLQQRVEILKMLYRGASILIFDEPTTVLTPQEVDQLIAYLLTLKANGKTIIFISHKLKEVFALCERVTVLRRGKKVGTLAIREATPEGLAEMMVGRRVLFELPRGRKPSDEVVFSAEGVSTLPSGGRALRDIHFTVHRHEIVGIAGVEGNGQTELAEAIVGLRRVHRGKLSLNGEDITHLSVKERIRKGLAHIPEDRHRRGVILDFTVMENLILGFEDQPPVRRGKLTLDFPTWRNFSTALIREFEVATPGIDTAVRALSGGNQQKVVLARELSHPVSLLLACQPTRGLDVAATEYLHRKILELKEEGKGILLISADLDEIRALSDRVLVLYEGRIIGELSPESDEYQFGLLMGGKTLVSA
ncbi:MAG: ABC transporter ATP-binding protein [Candidatus Caldatribacteriaceae bacterium]